MPALPSAAKTCSAVGVPAGLELASRLSRSDSDSGGPSPGRSGEATLPGPDDAGSADTTEPLAGGAAFLSQPAVPIAISNAAASSKIPRPQIRNTRTSVCTISVGTISDGMLARLADRVNERVSTK